MKSIQIVGLAILILSSCTSKQGKDMKKFNAEKVSKTATFTVDSDIETVYPLFGAFEESKWEKEWNPELIYPDEKVIEEGTTFKTKGHAEESEFLWRVSKFEPESYLIQYLVSTKNRYWTITVRCEPTSGNRTLAQVTYSFIGLNEKGNRLNKKALEKMYKNNLKDWEKALNHYLEFENPM